jgi:hypothetical protein
MYVERAASRSTFPERSFPAEAQKRSFPAKAQKISPRKHRRSSRGAAQSPAKSAGDRGIEPRARVLETPMLPLHQSPESAILQAFSRMLCGLERQCRAACGSDHAARHERLRGPRPRIPPRAPHNVLPRGGIRCVAKSPDRQSPARSPNHPSSFVARRSSFLNPPGLRQSARAASTGLKQRRRTAEAQREHDPSDTCDDPYILWQAPVQIPEIAAGGGALGGGIAWSRGSPCAAGAGALAKTRGPVCDGCAGRVRAYAGRTSGVRAYAGRTSGVRAYAGRTSGVRA